jgi:large subunit ribosomal protein LP1
MQASSYGGNLVYNLIISCQLSKSSLACAYATLILHDEVCQPLPYPEHFFHQISFAMKSTSLVATARAFLKIMRRHSMLLTKIFTVIWNHGYQCPCTSCSTSIICPNSFAAHAYTNACCPFDAPLLANSWTQGVPVTADAIKKIIDAAKVTDVESFWPGFFAKTAAGIDIKGLLSSVGSGAGSAPAAAAPAAAAPAAGKAAAPAAKAKAPEPEPEEEDSSAFSLFD